MSVKKLPMIEKLAAIAKENIEILYQNGVFDEVRKPDHPLRLNQHRLIKAVNGIVSFSKPRQGKGGRKV